MKDVLPYRWDARDYAQHSSIQFLWALELIRKLELKGHEHVLDIGCGDGKVTAKIASLLQDGFVLGVDSSDSMISLAKERYPANIYPNLRFQQENAYALPFREEFDVIFSSASLHWILDHQPVLQGIYQGLKFGGKILLQMGGQGNAQDLLHVLSIVITSEEWIEYFDHFDFPFGFYGPDEYHSWLKKAGLHARRVELIPKDMAHPSQESFMGWIRTVWLPYTQRVPVERRDEFISQVTRKYLAYYPTDEKGVTHIKLVRLEVDAFKPTVVYRLTTG